jgi:hypothetical protein
MILGTKVSHSSAPECGKHACLGQTGAIGDCVGLATH